MAFAKLIVFDRPLTGVSAPGLAGRTCSETELAAREEAAYRRGVYGYLLLQFQRDSGSKMRGT